MLLATFQAHCIASQGVAIQCVYVCVCPTLIIDHRNCLLACVVIIDKQVVLISGQPSSLLQRAHVAYNQQFPLNLNATLIIIKPFPRSPLLLSSLMQGLLSLSLSSPALLVSTTRTTSAAGTATAYWLIFTVYPQFCQREKEKGKGKGEGDPSEPCLKATERGQSFINSRLAKSTRPCAAIHQTALASVTQLHLCCCCLWASSFVWFILQLLQASSQAFGAYSCGLHTERGGGRESPPKNQFDMIALIIIFYSGCGSIDFFCFFCLLSSFSLVSFFLTTLHAWLCLFFFALPRFVSPIIYEARLNRHSN